MSKKWPVLIFFVLKILSTGDEDDTKQNIIFAISLKIGYSFSFTLKKSNGPYFANESLSVDEKEETSYFGASWKMEVANANKCIRSNSTSESRKTSKDS